jgi:hypothetical protein
VYQRVLRKHGKFAGMDSEGFGPHALLATDVMAPAKPWNQRAFNQG